VGEKQNQPFRLLFNPSLKVDFQGSRVTSDSGLLLVRELDERLGLSALIESIMDGRRGKNMQLPLPDLLRQSVYSRLAGYENPNDAEQLSQDPTFRFIGAEKIWGRGAALPSRLHWFETEVGRPRPKVQARVIRQVQQKPGDGSTHWSCRKLARVSAQQVHGAADSGPSATETAPTGTVYGQQQSGF
jgi:Transposase DDE domain group 1